MILSPGAQESWLRSRLLVSLHLGHQELNQLMVCGLTLHCFSPSPWSPQSLTTTWDISVGLAAVLHSLPSSLSCTLCFPTHPAISILYKWYWNQAEPRSLPHKSVWVAALGETTSHNGGFIKVGQAAAETRVWEQRPCMGHWEVKRARSTQRILNSRDEDQEMRDLCRIQNCHQEPQSIWAGGSNGQESSINFSEAKLNGNRLFKCCHI